LLHPCLLAVFVGLEIIKTALPVIVVTVETVHGSFGCSSTRVYELGTDMTSLKLLPIVQRCNIILRE